MEQRVVWSRGECGADGSVEQMGVWSRGMEYMRSILYYGCFSCC